MQSKNVSVIGGGILGMTMALNLQKKGYQVSLYEASANLGGLAEPWQIGDVSWDKFYHVILMSDLNTRGLLKELNIDSEMNWVETKTGFYTKGKLYSMSNSFEFLKFPPLGLIDKFRLGLTIFAASKMKNWRRLEKQKVDEWLIKWSGKSTFEKMWLPLLRAKLGENYTETSAAFIWATIQRMYAARKSGLKKEMFGYMQGGYRHIINSFDVLLKEKGVKVYTSYKLQSVSTKDGKQFLSFCNSETHEAEQLIFTIPSPLITAAWSDMPANEKEKHSGIKYLGVSCTSVLLKRDISHYYVTNITDTWVPFTGIIEMSALVDKKNFNGKALIYLPKYVAADDKFFSRTDEEIHSEFKEALLKMYPQLHDEDFLEMKTARARNVFALSKINYSQNLPVVKSEIEGVYYANSALITNGTLNVNETIEIANRISKEYF
jgi:protoporphyrinogen oxidase